MSSNFIWLSLASASAVEGANPLREAIVDTIENYDLSFLEASIASQAFFTLLGIYALRMRFSYLISSEYDEVTVRRRILGYRVFCGVCIHWVLASLVLTVSYYYSRYSGNEVVREYLPVETIEFLIRVQYFALIGLFFGCFMSGTVVKIGLTLFVGIKKILLLIGVWINKVLTKIGITPHRMKRWLVRARRLKS